MNCHFISKMVEQVNELVSFAILRWIAHCNQRQETQILLGAYHTLSRKYGKYSKCENVKFAQIALLDNLKLSL